MSVEAMRLAYGRALSSSFDTVATDEVGVRDTSPARCDAEVIYFDPDAWRTSEASTPRIFALHGDCISRRAFLLSHLGHLTTHDVLIMNNRSDERILRSMTAGASPVLRRLHFPVDTALFDRLDQAESRRLLGLRRSSFVIGFVGRLVPQKNLHLFLRALSELKKRLRPAHVTGLVLGDYVRPYPVLDYGADRYPQYIAALSRELGIADDLRMSGAVPHKTLGCYYNAMDLLFHPTTNLEEAFGSAPVEAMACGVPVVAAAYGGLKDTVISGETGFLMPTWVSRTGIRMDFQSGIEAAAAILMDSSLRARLSSAGWSRARRVYSYDRFESRLRAIVSGAVRRHARSRSRVVHAVGPDRAPASRGELPTLSTPWEAYIPSVSAYVSGELPRIEPEGTLFFAAGFAEEAGGGLRLRDPTWPALFTLTIAQRSLAEQCDGGVRASALMQNGVKRDALQDLVAAGILTYAAPDLVASRFGSATDTFGASIAENSDI